MKPSRQFAALPYVIIKGQVQVLLITGRRSGRWVIPKGWPENDMQGPELAALEAFEEAGVKGKVGKKSIGNFRYVKQGRLSFEVEVFPLKVKMQYLDWQEKGQRELRWLKPKKAADLIEEKDLAKLISSFRPETSSGKNSGKDSRKDSGKSPKKTSRKQKKTPKKQKKSTAKKKSKSRSRVRTSL